MDKLKTGRNLTQQLTHELGSAIVHGQYSSANSLPSEAEICERYNISRSATREAVKMLTAKGLISSRPRQGIRVLSQQHWNMFDTEVLTWILSGTPSLSMLKDFLQLRLAVEPQAAALAAVNADSHSIERIEHALARMKQAEKGLGDALEADIAFHTSLLLASGNPFFIQMLSFIETALRVSIRFTNRIKGVSVASYDDHWAIYTAIANKQAALAQSTSHAMQSEALALIQQQLELEDAETAKFC
ncbi:MAG: FadR family transcriptional regulator [Spongiibacteraceae bacterium]|nr:FadR family transcriptional regulator [Spongiibacteraceae bacterium]